MAKRNRIIIIAPFWRNRQYVGAHRIDRFVRWLSEKGVEIILVRAGRRNKVRDMPWGEEITVRDPLGLHEEPGEDGTYVPSARFFDRLRRYLVFNVFQFLFNPDPLVVWAVRAARNPLVRERMKDAAWVLASSPLESSHVASLILAEDFDKELIVDMRDGWLDEPLKRYLERPGLRARRESALESRILRRANRIFVTSAEWKTLLETRLPFTAGKTAVLTNAYPVERTPSVSVAAGRSYNEITLVYTGRLFDAGARPGFLPEYLLRPLVETPPPTGFRGGEILLYGSHRRGDLKKVASWKPALAAAGWSIEARPHLRREQALDQIRRAHGLLLLAACHACIPSKIFEYLPAGRPILAAAAEGNAVWNICERLPQVFLLDYSRPRQWASIIGGFLAACAAPEHPFVAPEEFSEKTTSKIFLDYLRIE